MIGSVNPTFYKSQQIRVELLVSSRVDKFGNIFFYVEFGEPTQYFRFKEFTSLMDFINSNFGPYGYANNNEN